jgi:predicted ATPase/DNA-binding SARP family transcriptional activator
VLGPPRVTVGGAPLSVDTRKALAVLAVLVLDGTTARERLASLLWPDSDERRARGALRRTLSVLVNGLGGRWVEAGRHHVDLDGTDAWIDLHVFAAATRTAGNDLETPGSVDDLAAAVALYRGELLEGFELRAGAAFDDWRHAHAERVRRELCRALDRLTRAELEHRDLDAAVAHARRWAEVDPLGEAAHARLMLAHAWRGEREEAVRRYRECAAILDRELGVRPLARTTSLYQAIVSGRLDRGAERPIVPSTPAVPATDRVSRPATDVSELPLVGRSDDLRQATEHLLDRGGGLVTIAGEAGIGKTRLVEELEAGFHRRGVPVLHATCHVGESGLALGPVVELLREAVRSPAAASRLETLAPWVRSEAARLLPQLADGHPLSPAPSLEGPGAKARFLEALVQLLATAATSHGPVVILEDLQHADDATIDLLVYALHRLDQHPLRLVLTWRGEGLPDHHPLHAGLSPPEVASRRSHHVLARLTADEVRTLCRSTERELAAAQVERLVAEAEGLPLAVVEYLRLLTTTVDEDGTDDAWPIPSGLYELVVGRLDALSETASQVATAASVLGHGIDIGLLGQTAGRSDDETVAAVEELQTHGILRPADDGTYDFQHEKLATVAYDRASPVRRRLLHARAATAMAAHLGSRAAGPVAGAIAVHARLGGDPAMAARWEVLAADRAASVFANADALTHLERALELDHPDPSAVHRRIARLLVLAGDYRAALARLETAAALAADPGALAGIEHELGGLHLRRGRWEAARAHLEGALRVVHDPGREARIRTDLGLVELRTGTTEAAEDAAAAALRLAEQAEDLEAIAQARNLAGLVARRRGHPAEAQRHLEHAAALAGSLPDPSASIAALNNLALATTEAGEPDRARALLETALERCVRLGDHHRRAALHNNLADLLHRAGDEEASMQHLKQAVSLFAEVGGVDGPDPEIWKLVDW